MQFLRYSKWFFFLSLLVIVPGVYSLIRYGLRPSIDFTGGTLLEVRLPEGAELTRDNIAAVLPPDFQLATLQQSGANQFQLKGSELSNAARQSLLAGLQAQFTSVEVLRSETIGPTLSAELLRKTLNAVVLVAALITCYIWYRFRELRYGVCATIAMFHDTLVLLGSFSLLGHLYGVEADVLFVTALLTTLSFSVHDTIVVYDRIRELRRKYVRHSYVEILDAAVTETLTRSINNSVTIALMLLSLSLLGGATVRWFAIALLIGTVTGTYSSPFTAVPLLGLWDTVQRRKQLSGLRQ
ncbi:MAG: protein-export membrane protein SecF [Candidatus Pacebacteria bacterium RIFCSPHIGHO2_01_FULL_46_16]|nr:MAG: protein-export membrane protein SecF [Candidatus Pacebacteria bacterium RIFCSPHIGHO2_01_FULL_46_16]OGJ37753.1 MAG: protein-export membrane protein SecF [Candidatus Pacebacteria bacterium RIFCSPLOWO2_01_FULL_47_12]